MNTYPAVETKSTITTIIGKLQTLPKPKTGIKNLSKVTSITPARLNAPSHSKRTEFRLTERVYHEGFGPGKIVAHSPDGHLIVRFDNRNKNQWVFPSFLSKVDHC